MRLGLKLAAFGIILLLPKTDLYLSNADSSEVQNRSEAPDIGSAAHRDVNSTRYLVVSAQGKQDKNFACIAKPEHDSSNTATVHAIDKGPTGS